MLKLAREKTVLKQALVIVGIMIVLYFFVLSPFLKEGSSILDEELERKGAEVKRYISRTGSLPSKESFDRMEKATLVTEERLDELIDFVDPKKVRVSESSSEAGLYFIERLHSSIKKFSEKAGLKEVKLPENLGFDGGLPKDNMVEILLRQLESIELVVDTLLDADTIEFFSIKPLRAIDYIEPLSKELFYSELPVQFFVRTDTKTLVNLLVKLKNESPMVSIKEIHVRSGGQDAKDIEVSIVLSTFMIKRAEES